MNFVLFTLVPEFSMNGYDDFASGFVAGANTMITPLATIGTPTPIDLNSQLTSWLTSYYYPVTPTQDQSNQLQAVMGNVYNAFVDPRNPINNAYNANQKVVISQMFALINKLSIGTSSAFTDNLYLAFDFINESIVGSGLSTMDQAPLLMASAIGQAAAIYFQAKIYTPTTPPSWNTFLDNNAAVNVMNFPRYIRYTMSGSLIGSKQSIPVVPSSAAQGTGIAFNLISAMGGALTLAFGSILFNWVPKPLNRMAARNMQG